jgi:hypothetical protein
VVDDRNLILENCNFEFQIAISLPRLDGRRINTKWTLGIMKIMATVLLLEFVPTKSGGFFAVTKATHFAHSFTSTITVLCGGNRP